MQLNTDFKLAGPLAGLFGGITQAQEQEGKGLQNAYQMLKNQEQEYTSAEAQAKLQDPRYIQMKLENEMTKFGRDTEINKLEKGYNSVTRALTDLRIAQQQGPEVLQQKALGYMKELGIDPNSQQGQIMLQDPVGFAEKTQQFYAAAATQNADYQQKYGLQEQKGKQEMDKQRLANEGSLAAHQVSANATRYAADANAANKDTQALITTENNLRQRVAQYDTTIERYARGDADAEIIANIRKANPKKSEEQIKSEAKLQREATVKTLREERDGLVKRADEIGDSVTGRLKLGQKAPTNTSGSTPPPPSGYKPI